MKFSLSILSDGICDYLKVMAKSAFNDGTFDRHARVLRYFYRYIKGRKIDGTAIFFDETVDGFLEVCPLYIAKVVIKGFSKFLYYEKKIDKPIGKYHPMLPESFSTYLSYKADIQPDNKWTHQIVLSALHPYLNERHIHLSEIAIADLDNFISQTYSHLATETQNKYRSCLRGFLRYLFNTGAIRKNLAPLLVGKRMFERSLPPRYLLPHEIRQLFSGMRYDTNRDLRANAMVYLAFTLGLRAKEISRITMDDIRFKDKEIVLPDRKNNQPAILPLSDEAIKAITAYIVGGRPRGEERALFLYLIECKPLTNYRVSKEITTCMRKSGLTGSSYDLRHTYAQQLLEKGTSVFEIKEMMGHEALQTTKRYLHVHMPLIRRVLFNETV